MPRTIKPLRWTLERAAAEFGIDRKTLAKRVTVKGIQPGDDGKFSTKEIASAVFSDGQAAKVSLALSQKENFDLRNKKLSGALVDPKQCQELWDSAMIALRQKISDAPIPEALKTELVKDLQAIPIEEYENKGATNETEDSD